MLNLIWNSMFYLIILSLLMVCALMGAPHCSYDVSFAIFGIDDIAFAIGAGSLISGAASIFGSSSANKANADAQAAANETNLQIARENNAFNKQERLETQQFNRPLLNQG